MDKFIAWLDKIIDATAWQVPAPRSYGPFHITFTLVGFFLCALIAWKLRNVNEKQSRRVIFTTGMILVFLEVYKQLLYHFHIDTSEGYTWWIFPFQLCSVPIYLCIIAPLLKKGRVQNCCYSFMMLYNLLGGFIAFFEPSGLLHPYATLTAMSCTWHMLLVFIGLFLVFSGKGGSTIKDYKNSTITFLALCVVAFSINLAFWDVSDHSINMFFIGPQNSSLIVFKQIAEKFGWYVSTALYIPTVCFGAYLIFLLITKVIHPKIKAHDEKRLRKQEGALT